MKIEKIQTERTAQDLAPGVTDQYLYQAASHYLELGIGVFLIDPKTGQSYDRTDEYAPITEKKELQASCTHHQGANLAVVIDVENFNLLAVEVSSERPPIPLPEPLDQLDNGATLSFETPEGNRYYLFRGGKEDLQISAPGVRVKKHPEPLLVPPSYIDGKPVKQLSETNQIVKIKDWLKGEENEKETVILDSNVDENDDSECTQNPENYVADADAFEGCGLKSLDSFIIDLLEDGQSTEATYEAALTHAKNIQCEEPSNKILHNVLVAAANIVVNTTGLDFVYAYLKELATLLMYLFIDEHDQPHVFMKDMGKVLPLADKAVVRYLSYHNLRISGHIIKAKHIKTTFEMLDVKTRYEGKKITLSNRVAEKDNHFYFDMGDANSVKVTADGWSIERSPILFRRFGHQMPQVTPEPSGDPWKLFDYLNVDEKDRLLMMVYIISLFVPNIAHPLLNVWGEHGSAKSFLCTAINQLCDPTSVTKLIVNPNMLDMVQNLYKHYVTVYDNLSEITHQMSDIFCQACTGSSFNKRRLYTDSEDVVFRIKHTVILNSIDMLLMRQDLIDRSIILHMKRIPPTRRRQEAQVWSGFEADKPAILGGIMDCLAKAKELYPNLPLLDLPRMADFYQWGYAITQALGRDGEEFVKAYEANIAQQNASIRHNHTLCEAVIELMGGHEKHESTVGATLKKLKEIAEPKATDTTFPKAPKDLVPHLKQVEPTLAEFGITFTVGKRQGRGTPLALYKDPNIASPESSGSPTSNVAAKNSEPSEADEAVPQNGQKIVQVLLDDTDFGGDI
jgi:hypothetical protein